MIMRRVQATYLHWGLIKEEVHKDFINCCCYLLHDDNLNPLFIQSFMLLSGNKQKQHCVVSTVG